MLTCGDTATSQIQESLPRMGPVQNWLQNVPMLAFPKKRPLFVEDDGGGGFWICDAVGAREERML
jgi:hypothetical protein